MVPYRDIPRYLQACEPFQGNTMSGRVNDDGFYEVYSYSTKIAEVGADTVWVSDKSYSRTTTQQQNLCRAHLPEGELIV